MGSDRPDIAIGDCLSCRAATAALLDSSLDGAAACSELLYGEAVRVLAVDGASPAVHVETVADGYRGFIGIDRLERPVEATHRVVARGTLCFADDDIKSPVTRVLPFGARLRINGMPIPSDAGLVPTARSDWARASHLMAQDVACTETPLALAYDRFLGAPYRWGGRSPLGCDCSGLVQHVHAACGFVMPRDSGPQERVLPPIDAADAVPGDLVFWPGHVAFVHDASDVLHATAHSLSVTIEPLVAVVERAGMPSGYRRVLTS